MQSIPLDLSDIHFPLVGISSGVLYRWDHLQTGTARILQYHFKFHHQQAVLGYLFRVLSDDNWYTVSPLYWFVFSIGHHHMMPLSEWWWRVLYQLIVYLRNIWPWNERRRWSLFTFQCGDFWPPARRCNPAHRHKSIQNYIWGSNQIYLCEKIQYITFPSPCDFHPFLGHTSILDQMESIFLWWYFQTSIFLLATLTIICSHASS